MLAERLGKPKMLGLGTDPDRVVASFQRWERIVGEDALVQQCVELAAEKAVEPSNLAWWAGWLDGVSEAQLEGFAERAAAASATGGGTS